MTGAFSSAISHKSSMPARLARRPVAALVTGLMALSLTACGGGDTANLIGTLDQAFGKSNDGTPDGMVSYSIGSGNDTTRGTVIQADGKILVVGTSTSTGGTTSHIVVERFNADGTIDTTFGHDGNSDGSPDGVVSLNLDAGNDEGHAIAVQADGKIVIVGTRTEEDNSKDLVVARLTAAGALDTSFGHDGNSDGTPDGVVSLSLSSGDDVANAIAIQHDGKILVSGTAAVGGDSNIAVARLNSDGSLDATGFGIGQQDGSPDGVVTLSLGDGAEEAVAIAVQADDRIVVVGNSTSNGNSNIVVARLNPDGNLDTFFGADNNDGTPDGVTSVNLSAGDDIAHAVAIQADGKILVAGSDIDAGSKDAVVARLNADGSIDTAFGVGTADGTPDGAVGINLGAGNDEIAAIAVDADGKIVVVGSTTSTGTSSNVFVARLLASGALDTSFGQGNDGTPDGVVNLSFGDDNDFGRAVALQADGKIIVAGDDVSPDHTSNIALARLLVKN